MAADNVTVNPGSGGDVIAADDVTTLNGAGSSGVKVQRVKVMFGDDGDARDASDAHPLPAILAAGQTHTVTPPAITKGTNPTSGGSAVGFAVQPLHDGGRAIVNAATAIAGVATVAAEALVALDISRDGVATASATTHPVTAAKRWRVCGILVGLRVAGANIVSAKVSLRFNPSGACTAASPIIATAVVGNDIATAETADCVYVPIPEGIEFTGTNQLGVSQLCNSVNGSLSISLIGFEY